MKCWLFSKTKIKEDTVQKAEKNEKATKVEDYKLKIKDLRIYDDVYIKINNQLYIAWVVEKTSTRLLLSYEVNKKLQDIQFLIVNLENHSIIKESDRVLILNKEDI